MSLSSGSDAVASETAVTVALRDRLLADPRNRELRQKYLAVRTPAEVQADWERAVRCLRALRWMRLLVGFALLGVVGGTLGELLLPATDKAVPIVVGLGCILSGSISFAVLAAGGHVVLAEWVGEERPCPTGPAGMPWLGWLWDTGMETLCGGLWGAVCGLLLGMLVGVADALGGLPRNTPGAASWAGACGGLLLGAFFGFLLLWNRNVPASATVRPWVELGPLPLRAYCSSPARARERYGR